MKILSKISDSIVKIKSKIYPQDTILLNKLFPNGIPKIDKSLEKDTFTKTSKKFKVKEFVIKSTSDRDKLFAEISDTNKKRTLKYGTNCSTIPTREVSKREFEAMKQVQYELGEYCNAQKKLRKGQELSNKEKAFCINILKSAKPIDENRTVWRIVNAHDGFEEQINGKEYNLLGFSSCMSSYDENFSEFWGNLKYSVKNGERYCTKPYFLKINLPKGTPVLDCNATYKGKHTRMANEVILMPGKCLVGDINEEFSVIELFYQN